MAQGLGSIVLLTTGLVSNQPLFMFLVFVWGVCGGIAMPMSRTLMQQLAPPPARTRNELLCVFIYGCGANRHPLLWLPSGSIWASTSHCDQCVLYALSASAHKSFEPTMGQ